MGEKKKVLLVDDDPDILTLLKSKIEKNLNYEVALTRHPSMILRLVDEESPDLIVCDIDMDERSGFKVAADLAADREGREIPFLFLTSLVDDSDVAPDGTVGDIWMMSKSSPMEEILGRIQSLAEPEMTD